MERVTDDDASLMCQKKIIEKMILVMEVLLNIIVGFVFIAIALLVITRGQAPESHPSYVVRIGSPFSGSPSRPTLDGVYGDPT